jgi:homoserine kinase
VAVGVAGLASGRFELLGRLTVDRLHEPYRAKAYPQLPVMVAAAREAGALGACLSGAGSTIIAFTDNATGAAAIEAALTTAAVAADLPGNVRTVALRNSGAQVVSRA